MKCLLLALMTSKKGILRYVIIIFCLACSIYSMWDKSKLYEMLNNLLSIEQLEIIQRQLERFDSSFNDAHTYVLYPSVMISAEPYASVNMRGWMEIKHKIIHFESRNELIHLPNDNPVAKRNTDGYLEAYIWWESCYTSIQALKAGLGFPYSPQVILETKSLSISRGRSSYAERIFGYITTSVLGEYRFSLTTYEPVEVWLSSDSNPHNSKLIISTVMKQTNRNSSQLSEPILKTTTHFYIEIIHISTRSNEGLVLQWSPPHHSNYTIIPNTLFKKIPPLTHDRFHSTLPMHFVDTSKYESETILTRPSQRIPQRVYRDIFPTCLSTDVLPLPHIVEQYYGLYELVFTNVYPYDRTQEYDSSGHERKAIRMYGNQVIPQKTIDDLISIFFTQTASAANLAILQINSIEEMLMKGSRARYLIDLTIEDRVTLESFRFIDYLFIEGSFYSKLCTIPDFKISQDIPFVYFIIIVKNLAQPLSAFITELESIYYKTGDENYGLIVVDFESSDADIPSMLSSSHLKNYKYISMSGPFIKVQGQNAALQSVTDDDVILFLCDLHLHIPVNILDDIRAHTIKGISAYAPVVFRLDCGHSMVNPVGYWEVWGGGLFAMYLSDWGVLGGMDTEHYSSSWGGEDSDLIDRTLSLGYEIERKGLPGLVHFYHTQLGLWEK